MTSVDWYELQFPKDLQSEHVLGFLRTLSMRPHRGLLRTTEPIIFELHADKAGVRWHAAADRSQQEWLQQQVRASLPDLALIPTDTHRTLSLSGTELGIELRVRQPLRPLRSKLSTDVSRAILAGLGSLASTEHLVLHWIVGPWLPRQVPKPSTPDRGAAALDPARLRVVEHLDYRDVRALEHKQEEPVYGAVGRLVVKASTVQRRRQLAQHVLGALQLVREPGTGLDRRLVPSWWVLRRYSHLSRPAMEWPCPLNAAELTSLLAWPMEGVSVPGEQRRRQRLRAPSPGVLVTAEQAAALDDEKRTSPLRIVGQSSHPAHPGMLNLAPRDALHHLHVVAPTGAGKSTLLANLALQDMAAGRAVVVIEPKGDLIEDLLKRIPTDRLQDVVLLDPTDVERPVGLNVLDGSNPELVVDQVLHVLHELYAAHWGPRTQDILHAGLLTLVRAGGYTLVDLPTLLTDPGLRRRLIPKVRDDLALGPFWAWFNALSDGERFAAIGPVMNKLRSFTLRESVRHVLGQAHPTFRFSSIFPERRILLVKLAKGQLGPETSSLIGALVISQLWNAVLARSNVDTSRRAPAMVYVDEFHDYTRLPTDLGDALAQARGLGVGITLAHQHLAQLNPDMRAAVLSNARSRIVFQTSDDAPALAKALGGGLTADDLRDLDTYQAYASLVSGGSVTPPASAATLPLPPAGGTAQAVRELSRERWGRPVELVRQEIQERQQPSGGPAPIGRKRRST